MANGATRNIGQVLYWSAFKSAPSFTTQFRTFTSSRTSWKGAIPAFKEASNPELEEILTQVRNNVILPTRLSPKQKQLVWGVKNKQSLEDEPVTVDIAGERFRLRHLVINKDIPSLRRTITHLKSRKDWDNLPILLEAFKNSRHWVGNKSWSRLANACVRKAGTAGRQDVIMDCVRRASITGFEMKDINLVREIMWWIQFKALESDWNPVETKKALGMAEQIADLLEDEKHSGGNRVSDPLDPRVRPEVIGVLLELAVAQAKISGMKEDKEKVAVYSKRLLSTMADGFNVNESTSAEVPATYFAVNAVRFLSPIIYAVKGASEILEPGSEDVQLLQEAAVKLTHEVDANRKAMNQEFKGDDRPGPTITEVIYEKLLGSNS